MSFVEEHKLLLMPIPPQICMFGPLLFRNFFMHDLFVKGSVKQPLLPRQFNAEQWISNQSSWTKCLKKSFTAEMISSHLACRFWCGCNEIMWKLLQNCVVSLVVSLGSDNDGKNVPFKEFGSMMTSHPL